MYDDASSKILQQMLVLTPQVFVTKLLELAPDQGYDKKDDKGKPHKYYPIELYVGGNLGNNGIEKSTLHFLKQNYKNCTTKN